MLAVLVEILAVLAGPLVSNSTFLNASSDQAQPSAIRSPDYWVAFDATVRTVSPRGVVMGRYYQASDGSTRNESGPENGPIAVVSISNVAQNRHFEFYDGTVEKLPHEASRRRV